MALVEHKQYALAREFLLRVVATDPSVENRLELAVVTFHAAGAEASLADCNFVRCRRCFDMIID